MVYYYLHMYNYHVAKELLCMVAHKCTPLRNTVRHQQGAAAVEW